MLVEVLEEPVFYDGSQIDPLWGYKHSGILGDSIIVFRGGMDVSEEPACNNNEMNMFPGLSGNAQQ